MRRSQKLDRTRYRRLIADVSPAIIDSVEENERVLAIVEKLMAKGERRSLEEDAVLNLLVHLVEKFEEHIDLRRVDRNIVIQKQECVVLLQDVRRLI